jgi:3-oxoacyl-[acyl-carrier protein] reductase
MFELSGKKALVTGASGAIGGAIARCFHSQGATVGLSGTRREALESLAAELGANVHVLPCDLTASDEVAGLIERAESAVGELDILVNNAGLTRDNLFARVADSDWERVLAVNLTAAFKLSREVLRGMVRRRSGRIVSITSVVAITGNPGQSNYVAAKAGLTGMTKSLAQEVATRNITINCVAPGFITSAMTNALNEKQRALILDRVPAKRLGTPDDVAAAVAFLASDAAGYITGQTIHVNGGMAMI